MQTTKTTMQQLKSPRDAPLISGTGRESFNLASLETSRNPAEGSKPLCHWRSGYNLSHKRKSPVCLEGEGETLLQTTMLKKEAALIPNARQWGIRAELK